MSKTEKTSDYAVFFIPAGLFLGFAAGFLLNQLPAGIFGGLGLGFLLFAAVKVLAK
ncbi:MAG: hypothetical protein QW400_02285 [Candidatus Diapherotrites archaeon]